AIHWADEGLGVALVPKSIAQAYAQSNIVSIKHAHWITHLNIVWRKDRQVTPLMERIIEMF
ncbi:LysR substrate-binding domain-containing protein, partial [Gardnerella leopoldii]|nr:LysR substrate-binding domain-containing protein [Gardnerella leopoldii]